MTGQALTTPALSLTDVAGVLGVLMMLTAYAAAQIGRLDSVEVPSLLLNLVGSSLVMLSLVSKFNLAAFLMEASWAAVAVFGLVRAVLRRRRGP